MTFATSFVLIAAGAILKYAITEDVKGVDLETVGLILMLVGLAGLALSLILLMTNRGRDADVVHERRVEREPPTRRY